MESTLKNMVLTLLIITLISAGALSVVFSMTKDTIEQSKSAKTLEALKGVLPEFDNDPSTDTLTLVVNNLPVKVYTARKAGTPVGYAVATTTKLGYSGEIKMMVGFEVTGEIRNIEVLEHNETPGLGSKIADDGNPVLLSFVGKSPADLVMKVVKDGGDIDVITASTISSRAYTDAVERAYTAFREVAKGETPGGPDVSQFFPATKIDNSPVEEPQVVNASGKEYTLYKGVTDGEISWVAVESDSEGYNGPIKLLVVFGPDGKISDISVISQMETDGYGAVIADKGNPLEVSFVGNNPADMKLSFKSDNGDVEAISGSSITSQAYTDAVENAYKAFVVFKDGEK